MTSKNIKLEQRVKLLSRGTPQDIEENWEELSTIVPLKELLLLLELRRMQLRLKDLISAVDDLRRFRTYSPGTRIPG